jgi:hypothetical protein
MEKRTELAYVTDRYLGTNKPLSVTMRIGDAKPITQSWSPSSTGQAAFSPAPIPTMISLTDGSSVFLRSIGFRGEEHDAKFQIGDFSPIRDKISAACHWPQGTTGGARGDKIAPAPKK